MFSLFFFARLTFLTGLFFGGSWALLLFEHNLNPELVSMVLTAGFGMGVVLFPSFVLACVIMAISGRLKANPTPRWLILANFIWFLLFIVFILFLNGPYYYQP